MLRATNLEGQVGQSLPKAWFDDFSPIMGVLSCIVLQLSGNGIMVMDWALPHNGFFLVLYFSFEGMALSLCSRLLCSPFLDCIGVVQVLWAHFDDLNRSYCKPH